VEQSRWPKWSLRKDLVRETIENSLQVKGTGFCPRRSEKSTVSCCWKSEFTRKDPKIISSRHWTLDTYSDQQGPGIQIRWWIWRRDGTTFLFIIWHPIDCQVITHRSRSLINSNWSEWSVCDRWYKISGIQTTLDFCPVCIKSWSFSE